MLMRPWLAKFRETVNIEEYKHFICILWAIILTYMPMANVALGLLFTCVGGEKNECVAVVCETV